MQKVKITSNGGHPRLNVGFVYNREITSNGDWRFTSLGGKHSVCVQPDVHRVSFEVVADHPAKFPQHFHTEPHVRIGERVAADLWREEYIGHSGAPAECAKFADEAVAAFLKRWEDGFFRGGVAA